MSAELILDLPWVDPTPEQLDGLAVRRGRSDVLTYDDGISLEVVVIDPAAHRSPEAVIEAVRTQSGPGRAVLVAGAVPLSWRASLRDAEISFVDVSGVAEIRWPRLHVSARRFGQPVKRHRSPIPLQKGNALVVEELLIASVDEEALTISGLAEHAGVSSSTVSRAVTQLAEHGLVTKERDGNRLLVRVVDRVEIANRLAERSAWPGDETLSGFLWGRSVFDVAARLSEAAGTSKIELAVTGRVGAAFHGVLGTSSPTELRCWVRAEDERELPDIAAALGLDPAPGDAANVVLSADPWRAGVHRRAEVRFDNWSASVAHPVRVWCDLHDEPRGVEFAAQMWRMIADGR